MEKIKKFFRLPAICVRWFELVKYNEVGWDIWRNMTERERADVARGRYPNDLLARAKKQGYELTRLKEELKKRAQSQR